MEHLVSPQRGAGRNAGVFSADKMAAARERARIKATGGDVPASPSVGYAFSTADGPNNTNNGTPSSSRRAPLGARDGNAGESKDGSSQRGGEGAVGGEESAGGPREMDAGNGLGSSSSDPFNDGDAAVLDVGENMNYAPMDAGDFFGLDKALAPRPSLIHCPRPIVAFPTPSSLFPEGRGEGRSIAFVHEVISGDLQAEAAGPAYHAFSLAGEAIALHRGGKGDEVARSSRFTASSSTDDSAAPTAALLPHLTLLDDGIARGKQVPTTSINLQRMADREIREAVHGWWRDEWLYERQNGANASSSSSALTTTSPISLSPGLPGLPDTKPRTLLTEAARIVPRPLGDPVDPFTGRPTSAADFANSGKVGGRGNGNGVGAIQSTIGVASFAEGAATASEFDARMEILVHAAKANARSLSSSTMLEELPQLRIVRPLVGDSNDLALANAVPATLTVEVGSIAFRDHPLFAREDYLASGLRSLYAEYTRRMRSSAVASLDMRLRALLAYSMSSAAAGSSTTGRGGAAANEEDVVPVYDFEQDGPTDLCARAGAVLEALSERYENVTGAAEVMKRLWATWNQLKVERTTSGFTSTSLRLDAREVTQGVGGSGSAARSPTLHPVLYATACLLDRLRAVAESYAMEGDVAMRLVDAGSDLLTRIHDGEQKMGRGHGCGGLGSGLADVPDLIPTSHYSSASSASSASAGTDLVVAGAHIASANASAFPYPGAREFVIRLHDDDMMTPDHLVPIPERKRRMLVRSTFVCAEVRVNGKPVARGPAVRLTCPGFTAQTNMHAAIRLFRRPASVSVRILDATSFTAWLFGPAGISEVLVPVPGQADMRGGRGNFVDGGDDDGVAGMATSALEPVFGTYEFSASQPMSRPIYTHGSTAATAAAAAMPVDPNVAASGAAAMPLQASSSTPGVLSSWSSQRLTCGDVGVTVAWQAPTRTETGVGALAGDAVVAAAAAAASGSGSSASAGGAGSSSHSSSSAAASSSSGAALAATATGSSLIAVPPLESLAAQQGVDSASWATVVRAIGHLGSTAVTAVTSSFSSSPEGPGRRTVASRHSTAGGGGARVGGASAAMIGASQQSLGDTRLIREFASLPVPRAMGANAMGSGGAGLGQGGLSATNTSFAPARTLSSSFRGGAGGTSGTPAPFLSNTLSGGTLNRGGALVGGGTMRRSQAMAAAENALELARAGVQSVSIPVQGIDPNDPRAILAGVGRTTGPRSTRFRVSALPQALAFSSGAAGASGGGMSFGAGALEMVGGAMGALMPLPGKQRQQLLRLRGERPDLFRDVHEAIPLLDDDIAKSVVLRELLRSALISMGYAEQTADAMQYGPLAYLRQGAKALGISTDGSGSGGAGGGSRDFATGGAGSASSVAKARLLYKIRDFLSRVRATPGGAARFANFIAHSSVVKELSLPALQAFINITRILALLAPRRALRPRAIDLGIPLDLGGPMAGFGFDLGLGAGAIRGLAPEYRVTIQIVRARNVPVRRAFSRSFAQMQAQQAAAAGAALSPARGGATPATPGRTGITASSLAAATAAMSHNLQAESDTVVTVVEARFQGRAVRTSASSGPNPQWNEIVSLPFVPPSGDVTPARLADVQDCITLSLFDEAAVEVRVDERDKMTTVIRRQRRFLGSISIPFVSLYAQGGMKLEARLETPLVNLGYRAPSVVHVGASTLQGTGGVERVNAANTESGMGGAAGVIAFSDPVGMAAVADANRRATHLYLHMSVDPPLPVVEEDAGEEGGGGGNDDETSGSSQLRAFNGMRFEGSAEMHRILEYAAKWSDRHSARLESVVNTTSAGGVRRLPRIVRAIASNIVSEPVLVTRYLSPQAPPPDAAAAVAAHMQASILRSEEAAAAAANARNGGAPRTPTRAGTNSQRRILSGNQEESGEDNANTSRRPSDAVAYGSDSPSPLDPNARMPIVSSVVPRMASVDAVARYVSLIPYMADTHAFGSHNVEADVWATSQECLDMGAGDAEEHAIMLHNYLTWFERQEDAKAGISIVIPSASGGVGAPQGTPTAAAGGGVGNASGPGWRSYIVLGRAQPDGETTWVLRQHLVNAGLNSLFINACSGRSYLASDDTCPLTSIGMVATSSNAWANIQPFTEPWRMSFDLSDARCWAPLFTLRRPHPGPYILPSVQPDVTYRVPDTRLAAALESEIAGAVVASLRAWRPRFITRVRGDVSSSFKPLLLELEARSAGVAGVTVLPASEGLLQVSPGGHVAPVTVGAGGTIIMPNSSALTTMRGGAGAGGGGGGAGGSAGLAGGVSPSALASAIRDLSGEHSASLERLVARYRPSGCPINLTFTDLDAVLAAVKATGIHRIEDEAVQYAVGVAVIPYPNDIFSVWIYTVALLPA